MDFKSVLKPFCELCNPNLKNGIGDQPLVYAIKQNNFDAFEELLKNKANINLKSTQGYYPVSVLITD